MKIVFFGSDDFAVVHLKKIISSSHSILAVVTQPDRAKGRGMKVGISPVKELAGKKALPVLQPMDLADKNFIGQLKKYECDLFVVIAYGKFLPKDVLAIPRLGAINGHGSLLPQYRGAAPINWAIINGEKQTGVSIIQMNEKMDAGDIIAQSTIDIDQEDTSIALRAKMAELGSQLLMETLKAIEENKCSLTPQKEAEVSFAPKLRKEMGTIDWTKSAVEIHNLVRGLLPWPSATTYFNGKMLKVIETAVAENSSGASQPGEICDISSKGIVVATGQGTLLIKKVHPESSKAMDAASFAAGHKIAAGYKF